MIYVRGAGPVRSAGVWEHSGRDAVVIDGARVETSKGIRVVIASGGKPILNLTLTYIQE